MNNQTIKSLLIILVCTMIFVIVFHFAFARIMGNALLTKLVPFMKKWEGGLSRDPNDTASAYPAPWTYNGVSGWHTNKGITYQTFESNAYRLGYEASEKNFFEMPDDIWLKILKGVYMKAFPLDEIAHLPRIQAVIITWAWGSGTGGAERRLANFQREEMGIQDSDITPEEIVNNFRKRILPINELVWFNRLCDRRAEDFSKMQTFSVHGKGWLNRLDQFRKLMT